MKKSSFAFLILSLIATNAIAQQTDWERCGLKGEVKNKISITFYIKDTVRDWRTDNLYDLASSIDSSFIEFDSLGSEIYTSLKPDATGFSRCLHQKFSWNKNKTVFKGRYTDEMNNKVTEKHVYDKNDRMVESCRFEKNLKRLQWCRIHSCIDYDEKNRKTKDITIRKSFDYGERFRSESMTEYIYGETDSLILMRQTDDYYDGPKRRNDRNKLVTERFYGEYGELIKMVFIYTVFSPDGQKQCDRSIIDYVYDEHYNVIDKISESTYGNRHDHYEYEYDEMGNCVAKAYYLNGKLCWVNKCEIEYYRFPMRDIFKNRHIYF